MVPDHVYEGEPGGNHDGNARKGAKYEDLYDIPDNMVAEIVDGELIVTPRPTSRHGYAATALIEELGPPYHRGRGGPGGWVFLVEPEITFGNDTIVPDVAGWKAKRFVWEQNPIPVIPDWLAKSFLRAPHAWTV